MLTQDCLRRLWPRAPASTVAAIARTAENVFASTGITITNANAGGDGAHNIVQPTMLMNSLIRII